MVGNSPDTDALVHQAAAGDAAAVDRLMNRYRARLRKMVCIRLSPKVSARVDPSDIVQESLAEAARRITTYVDQAALPFYPWLRQLAWDKILQAHRAHLHQKGRSVSREDPSYNQLPQHSTRMLLQKLLANGTNPSQQAIRQETRHKVQTALKDLSEPDREILVLRYLEGLSVNDIAAVLELTVDAVKSRQRRALVRFASLVKDVDPLEP